MVLDVESLLRVPEEITRWDFSEWVEFPEDLGTLRQPLAGEVTVTRSLDSQALQVQGHLATHVDLNCDRCLGPVPMLLEFEVDERLVVVATPSEALEAEEAVAAGGSLDLSDLLRQHLILNLPSRHHCGCEPAYLSELKPIDPRWRPLESLFHRSTEEESRSHGTT